MPQKIELNPIIYRNLALSAVIVVAARFMNIPGTIYLLALIPLSIFGGMIECVIRNVGVAARIERTREAQGCNRIDIRYDDQGNMYGVTGMHTPLPDPQVRTQAAQVRSKR